MPDAMPWEEIVERWPEFRPCVVNKYGAMRTLIRTFDQCKWAWSYPNGVGTYCKDEDQIPALCRDRACKLLAESKIAIIPWFDGWCAMDVSDTAIPVKGVRTLEEDYDTAIRLAIQAVKEMDQ